MLDDREHEKIVRKAEKLQNKAGPEREEVLWKRTKAAAGKIHQAVEETALEWGA